MDVVAAESVYLAAQSWWGTGQGNGRKSPRPSKEGVDPAWSSWAWGLVVEACQTPESKLPLLCPGPLVLQGQPRNRDTSWSQHCACPLLPCTGSRTNTAGSLPRQLSGQALGPSSAGTREGREVPPAGVLTESRQLRAGPDEQTPHRLCVSLPAGGRD